MDPDDAPRPLALPVPEWALALGLAILAPLLVFGFVAWLQS